MHGTALSDRKLTFVCVHDTFICINICFLYTQTHYLLDELVQKTCSMPKSNCAGLNSASKRISQMLPGLRSPMVSELASAGIQECF